MNPLGRPVRLVALLFALTPTLGAGATPATQVVQPATPAPDLQVFVGRGCPHCARALAWLDALTARQPDLRVRVEDVVDDAEALGRLRELSDTLGLGGVTVPTFVVRGTTVLVGFDAPETTGGLIERLLGGAPPPPGAEVAPATPAGGGDGASVTLPWVGTVRLDEVGLPAFTIAIGLLDGFNPCAMWVLLFLLSLLVHVRSRTRMALVGGVFVVVGGAVYYAFMAAWLNAFLLLGAGRWVQAALGSLALLLGGLNVKDFFWLGRGPSLGIPERAKPGIYAKVRRVATAERLGAALATAALLAALVNTVELLCTAGLPALYTRILTLRGLSVWSYHGYLALYIACYMLDDALVLGVAVITLTHHRLRAGEARWLKLASGAIMLILGAILLLEPEALLGSP